MEAEKRKNSKLANELDECKSKVDVLDQKLRSRVKNYKSEQEEITKKEKEISLLQRENMKLTLEIEGQQDTVDRITNKFRLLEQNNIEELLAMKEELENVKNEKKIQEKIYEDKSKEVQELKIKLNSRESEYEREMANVDEVKRSYENALDNLEDEKQKLLSKISKKTKLLDEYEVVMEE